MNKIKLKEIIVNKVEGLSANCGKVVANSFKDANETLKTWAKNENHNNGHNNGGCYKVDFMVLFQNEKFSYTGQFDLKGEHGNEKYRTTPLLQNHMIDFIKFDCGLYNPNEVYCPEYYENYLTTISEETKADGLEWINNIDWELSEFK